MHKRFHVQRQHIIHSLDTLLYQLHTLSFFLSPSLWIYVCRIIAQFQCIRPRELDANRSLRFFYFTVIILNVPSLWNHSTKGASEGRAIILDFIGMAHTPSKAQLFLLDISIVFLQLVLTTIAYETSVYYTSAQLEPEDFLLPDPPTPFSIPLFRLPTEAPPESPIYPPSPSPQSKTVSSAHSLPYVLDLRFNAIMTRLRTPPPPPPVPSSDSFLPLPNTTPWRLPGLRMLLRTGRQIRTTRGTPSTTPTDRQRVPGAMEAGSG
ncbi:hypothetical protein NLJ89_g625 [Agrocybe chaxingu]|uniref:DUF1746 domain-containing protein n=1 Tax=Agrocybe chaxingu TaxID=84603 RepID=A0A9W8TEL5_9AGAR|nr:hypothetical protein NLJ89_g625 [Agrocybe chaxingu]